MMQTQSKNFFRRLKINVSPLVIYDLLILAFSDALFLARGSNAAFITLKQGLLHFILAGACLFGVRALTNVYGQVWRYGGIQSYIRLILTDTVGGFIYYILTLLLPDMDITFPRAVAICSVDLLLTLSIRMTYRYAYKCGGRDDAWGKILRCLLHVFSGDRVKAMQNVAPQKIRVAIVGAGRVGVSLSEELLGNPNSAYFPCLFIETDKGKIDRYIHNIPVYSEAEALGEMLTKHEVQEIIIAVPQLEAEKKRKLYETYKDLGYKVKVYDFPVIETETAKRSLREFDVEELLFRKPMNVLDEQTGGYYRDKVIMITGGGGSIGSELCRQLAKEKPKQLVLLDVYENGAYDVQQELKIRYGDTVDVRIAIVSVCNIRGLERVFAQYRPQIVFHAAAHKHVPLMETDCVEAVENNVFGTLNTVKTAEKFGVERFLLVSSDKAVNPTNIMGATKRMCEMIVQNHSKRGTGTTFAATRFGNVLGSAGSVIPLFRKQIAYGGPITITDKRIIRYFMTIPEAAQLLLKSGAMAKNGELFVLDMGKPVKILDLAENMIRLAGKEPYKDIDIVETGLRPGEKLYEELLIKTEELDKTENSMIFIERDDPPTTDVLEDCLDKLRLAIDSNDNNYARDAMMQVVPTYHRAEEVNAKAEQAEEMRIIREVVMA